MLAVKPMTKKQSWVLFTKTGYDCREILDKVERDKASELVGKALKGEDISQELEDLGAKKRQERTNQTTKPKQDWQKVYKDCHKAGQEAVEKLEVRPMVVSDGTTSYFVGDGACGFAWISFKGNTSWAKWCKKNKLASKDYPTGLMIWVSAYNQSMQKKEEYAKAFAAKLREFGVDATARSRMD